MGVDVVRAVLRIVLDHEYSHLLPEPALREPFHQPSQRQIVVTDARRHGPFSWRRSGGVVVRKAENYQARHLAGLLKLSQLLKEAIRPLDVGKVHVEATEEWIEMPLESFDRGRGGFRRRAPVGDPFSVAAI